MNIKVTVDDTEYSGINKMVIAGKEMDLTATQNLQTKTITTNGTYAADTGYDGLNQVTVNIPSGVDAVGFVSLAVNSDGNTTEAKIVGLETIPENYIGNYMDDILDLPEFLSDLEELTIEDAASIGEGAFCGIDTLTTVVLEDDIVVASQAFKNCTSLSDVTFNGDVILRSQVFADCNALENITFNGYVTIPEGSGGGVFEYTNSDLTEIEFPYGFYEEDDIDTFKDSNINTVTIGNGTTQIYIEDNIRHLTIGNGTVSIGSSSNSNIETISIGNSSTASKVSTTFTTGDGPFSNCTYLESVYINNGTLSGIGDSAFYGCTSLSDVTIYGLTTINNHMFYGCSSLEEFPTFGNAITYIDEVAFKESGLSGELTIPSSVTTIADEAFSYCYNLTKVTITAPSSYLSSGAFMGCSNVTELYILGVLTNLSEYSFSGFTGLTDLYVSWAENEYENAPWGAPSDVTIHYNYGNEPS